MTKSFLVTELMTVLPASDQYTTAFIFEVSKVFTLMHPGLVGIAPQYKMLLHAQYYDLIFSNFQIQKIFQVCSLKAKNLLTFPY